MTDPRDTDPSTIIAVTPIIAVSNDGTSSAVIAVSGDLDLTNADELRAAVDDALTRSTTIVFDMAALTFMDSSGLAVLIDAARRAESVELHAVPPVVSRVIEITGVAGVFSITT